MSKQIAGYKLIKHEPHSRLYLYQAIGVPNEFKVIFNGTEIECFGFWGESHYKSLQTRSGRIRIKRALEDARAFKAELAKPW